MKNKQQSANFVKTIANNVGYINKELAVQQINQFLNYNQSFTPYEGFRSNGPDSFFSFIQLIGYVNIGKILSKTYIGVPKNYPSVPPIFLFNFNSDIHQIFDCNRLIQQDVISIEKNQFQQSYIKLRVPILTKQWDSKKNLLQIFGQVERIVNSPPIIFLKKSAQQKNRKNVQVQQRRAMSKIESKKLQQILDQMNINMSEMNSQYNTMIEHGQFVHYYRDRTKYIEDFVPDVTAQMKRKSNQIAKTIDSINEKYTYSIVNKSCDQQLEISQKDQRRIQLMSQQQALKQAESAVRRKIQNCSDQNNKYGEYKKIVKSLYDQMFDNKTKMIKLFSQ